MRPGRRAMLLMSLILAPLAPAGAAWQKASSRHFVIYSDDKPERLHEFADRLERFDAAVRRVRAMDDPEPGDNNRVTIFVLPSPAAVAKLLHGREPNAYGFYTPRASGSLAFVPRVTGGDSRFALDPDTVLFHEYAHHLMFQDVDQAYPPWFIEGFAEFMSTARIERDGGVGLGLPAMHRARSLALLGRPSLAAILNLGAKPDEEVREQVYARGWLLTHYLTFEPKRKGQLADYLARFGRGTPALEAAQAAFGDLKQLDRELDFYRDSRTLKYLKINAGVLKVAPVSVAALSPGAAAVMPVYLRLRHGIGKAERPAAAARIRSIEASYRGDELVEQALAEVELDAGNDAAAALAADRAIAADPRCARALTLKGRALLHGAKGDPAAIGAARKVLLAANKLDTEDPEPLLLFYQSYRAAGQRPTDNALAALHYAARLAPQDGRLRMESGIQFWRAGKLGEARAELMPVAYNPHGGALAVLARQSIASLDQRQPPPETAPVDESGDDQASIDRAAVDIAGGRIAADQIIGARRGADGAADMGGAAPQDLGVVADARPVAGPADRREDARAEPAALGQPAADHLLGREGAASAHPQIFALTGAPGAWRMAPATGPSQLGGVAGGGGGERGIPLHRSDPGGGAGRVLLGQ